MSENNNLPNGFSSRDLLQQIWSKMDAIELKLDTRLSQLDRKVVVLELETVKRDGPLAKKVEGHEQRLSSIETIAMTVDKNKGLSFNKKTLIITGFALLINFALLITESIILFLHYHS